jgi:hypothetical protein
MGSLDHLDRQIANNWIGVGFEGRFPLAGVFSAFPARLVCRDLGVVRFDL